jgi:hypothetical protein
MMLGDYVCALAKDGGKALDKTVGYAAVLLLAQIVLIDVTSASVW